jgi:catechol 2,3-dioxygenase-like lactoylglutathione lyase family enzyme
LQDKILGIHHITAIAGDPQPNLEFYTDVLGLRLVKLTVNFDDPGAYHFYFGNGLGAPGTIMTFFTWPGAPRGRQGTGQAGATAFAIPDTAVGYWADRLKARGVTSAELIERFGQPVIAFHDPDGLPLELAASPSPLAAPWQGGSIPAEKAIQGFFGITLAERKHERSAPLLAEVMGFRLVAQEGPRYRYQAGEGTPGSTIDVLDLPDDFPGQVAVGTIHHVAFRTPDDDQQSHWLDNLQTLGLNVSPVMDRVYFHSIYFREPGGILFEIATDSPGFTVDETPEALGTGLRLPPWLEPQRAQIEAAAPPVQLPQLEGRAHP